MIQAHQRRSTHERHSRRHYFYNNLGDHLRFRVGASVDLTHKTGDSKMTVANKDGWIRNLGQCPVEKGTLVDVKYLCGEMAEGVPALIVSPGLDASSAFWCLDGDKYDIMQWRLSKPKPEQQEPQPMTAEQIRAQYMENLSSIAMLHTKNAALVDDLRKMGFDFYDAPTDPQEDMTDPKNWRVGDILEHTSNKYEYVFTCGGKYTILRKTNNGFVVRDDISDIECGFDQLREEFKFHSRPTK